MHSLELYKKDTCGYCAKVRRFIDEQGRTDIRLVDIVHDEGAAAKLVEVGGKLQVPCLFIDGRPMYESDDIIEWLRNN